MTYFSEPDSYGRNKIKAAFNLSNYATKPYIKHVTGVDTPDFAKKANLAGLKSNVDKSGIDKLKTFPIDLSKLRIVVKNVFKNKKLILLT